MMPEYYKGGTIWLVTLPIRLGALIQCVRNLEGAIGSLSNFNTSCLNCCLSEQLFVVYKGCRADKRLNNEYEKG